MRNEEIKILPDFLYHITPLKNISSIMSKGLDPNRSKSSFKNIYLSISEDIAKNYESMYDEPCVLLKINTSFLNEDLLFPDDYELKDYLDSNDVGINYWKDCSYLQSLNFVGQCSYQGLIRAEAIEKV